MVSGYFVLEQLLYHAVAGGSGLVALREFYEGRPVTGVISAGIGLLAEGYAIYNGLRHLPEIVPMAEVMAEPKKLGQNSGTLDDRAIYQPRLH